MAKAAILTGLASAATSTVLGKIMQKDAPPPPVPEPVEPMPTMDSDSILAVKKKSLQAQTARQGRASTILTDPTEVTDKLGG